MNSDEIDELRRTQAALAASEARLARVLRGSNDGWWDWDLVADTLFYSPRWWTMLGLQPGELPADTGLWRRLLHPEDHAHVDLVLASALLNGPDHCEVEFRLRHKAGHYLHVLARGLIQRDDGGRAIRISGSNMDLSARKAAEQAQHETETSYRALLEGMADGVFVSQDERFVFANPALSALLGWSLEEFIGTHFEAVIAPEMLAVWTQRFWQRVGTGPEPPAHYEVPMMHRDGHRVRCELRASRVEFRGRTAVLGIVRDVGERRLAEERIASLHQRLALAIRGAGYGVWEYELDRGVLVWDEQMLRLYGMPAAHFDGSPAVWQTCVHPHDRATVDERFAALMAGESVDHFEFRILRVDDGALRHVEGTGYLQRDAEGQPRRLVGMNRDVTELRLAEAALRESEQRWNFALEGAGDGVWDWRVADGQAVYSHRWKEMIGYGDAEIGTAFDEWLSRVHPEDLPRAQAALESYFKGEATSYAVEFRMRCKDDSWKWILARGLVVSRDADGRPLRMVGTHTDLSERKQAEQRRDQLESQLREAQKMEALGTLAGGIAHDFNNVLAAILGNVALARQDLPAAHPVAANLDLIERGSLRARSLVHQILAFSRRRPQVLTAQDLGPVVAESVQLLRATLPAVVELEGRIARRPLPVLADAMHVQQVLMNLCTNAWQALQGSSGRIEVGLAEALVVDGGVDAALPAGLAPGRYAHVWVSDNGCGMDAAACARVFEPFYTTKPDGQGTGLGLAVVHGIVSAHGGAISVRSEPGRGSTFHLCFPLVAAEAEAPGGAPSTHAAPLGGGEHVLYVDDDELMVITVQSLLTRAGYRVTTRADGRSALAVVEAAPRDIDLVVSDYNMPGYSGLELAQALAALRADLPVVISSGFISEALQAEARALGVRGLLHKENTVEELGPLVRRLLRGA
ncbi:MAG TPA: PAS domain-containing protein [Methylibium sp.]|nr:PAS domain-containing protein [Methylibium sp.]